MTSETDVLLTNDVCDKEGQPADNEHTHHGSQSFCSFRLFRDPCHEKNTIGDRNGSEHWSYLHDSNPP